MSPRRPDGLRKEEIGYTQITVRVPTRIYDAVQRVDYKKLGYWSRAEWVRAALDEALKTAPKR
jgi:metal-responsive CopG/Arc/MetJ family transcriptional regulator